MLAITKAKRQDDSKRKNKRTAFFKRAGLWGSGSTGQQAKLLLKLQIKKKTTSVAIVNIDIYIPQKKPYPFKSVYCNNL